MSIDWITVAAQVANFLVLVWLLKRFLYRPILDGIDAREAQIAERMQQAVVAKEKAQAAEKAHLHALKAVNSDKAEELAALRKQAQMQRDALLGETRARLEAERADWTAQLAQERQKYTVKLHHAGGAALLALTRKALGDLADAPLEGQMAALFAQRICAMSKDLRAASGKSSLGVISSRDPLPDAARAVLTQSLSAHFPDATFRFEARSEQPFGLILRIGGAQLEWTVESYLDGLTAQMEAQLAAAPKAAAA